MGPIKNTTIQYKVVYFIMLMLAASIVTATPNAINIQGKLTNTGGTLQTGTFNFTFSIYNNQTNGTLLYETNVTETTDSRGIYDIILSDINLPFDKQYFLGISVNEDTEMTPRINLTSVPYSITANTSETLNATRDVQISTTINLTTKGDISANGTIHSNILRADSQVEIGGGFGNGGATIQSDGTIMTQGDIIFSGNVTIINVSNLNVNGSLIPDTDNTFDIGNGSNRWRNANFSGTVEIETLEVTTNLLGWTNLTNYPSACTAGQFISAIGDSITCASPGETSSAAGGWTNNSNDTSTSRNVIVTAKDGSDFVVMNTSIQRVGIGTSNPNQKLVVEGSVNATGNVSFGINNTFIVDSTNKKVGIGTNNPQANLHLFPRLGQVVALNITSEIAGMTTTAIISDAANGAEPLLRLVGDADGDVGGPNNFVFTKDGDLGVGIINPTARLHVNTSAADSVEIAHFTTNGSTQIQIDTDSNNNIIQRFFDSTGTEKIKFHTGGTSFIDIGNVGIGTTSPTEKLVVMGNVSINASTGVNTTLFVDSTNGRVGINNSNPTALLTVGSGTDSAGQSNVAGLFSNDGPTTLAIRDSLNDVEGNMFVTSGGVYIGSFTNSALTFRTSNVDQMMLTTDGFLGIGTRNPRARLEVLGNTTFLGNMTLGNTTAPVNLTMYSPNGNAWRCGPDNSGTWSCSN